jgi:hypothetical protein
MKDKRKIFGFLYKLLSFTSTQLASYDRSNIYIPVQRTDAPAEQDIGVIKLDQLIALIQTELPHYSNITTVSTATYDLLLSDDILHVTRTATGTCAIDLKTAQVIKGREITIKDASLNAGTYNITVTTEGAETIDGAASLTINGDGDSYTLYCDGTNWFIK